ncbi:MAG: hypothetical protein WCA35_25435 [Kovacikia sp.]
MQRFDLAVFPGGAVACTLRFLGTPASQEQGGENQLEKLMGRVFRRRSRQANPRKANTDNNSLSAK